VTLSPAEKNLNNLKTMSKMFKYIFLFLSFISYSQNGVIKGKIYSEDKKSPSPGLSLNLIKDGKVISKTQTDYDGNYLLSAPFGIYDLKINTFGYQDKLILNLSIDSDSKTLDTFYPNPCIESYGICPYNHKDEIIPIIYGLPSKKMVKLHKKGKVSFGGCFSGCAKWYCKKHDLSF
jgi:hypothetical protein